MSPIVNENLVSETLLNLPPKLQNLAMRSTTGLRLPTYSSPLPAFGKPYVLDSDQGETITLVGSGSTMRYLATARETEDQFAVVHTRARADVPVPAQ